MIEKHQISSKQTSQKKQLGFALLVFERMLPDLIAFSKETGFNDSYYLQARDAAWGALRDGAVDQALTQACLQNAPDTEQFSHILTSYALNAALAISDIGEFTNDGNKDHIEYVSTLARDSIYLYLNSLEPTLLSTDEQDKRIAYHPLMKQEQQQEEEDARFLSELPDQFDENIVSTLRARASTQVPLLPVAS